MRWLKRILLTFLFLFFFILTALVGLGVWVYHHPQETWNFVEKRFLPADLHVEWERLKFQGERKTWTHFRIHGEIDKLVVTKTTPSVDTGIKHLSLDVDIFLRRKEPWFHVADLKVWARETNQVQLPESPEDKSEQNFYQTARQVIDLMTLVPQWLIMDQLDVDVPEFQLQTAEGANIVLQAQVHKEVQPSVLDFKVKVHTQEADVVVDGKWFWEKMKSPETFLTLDYQAQAMGHDAKGRLGVRDSEKNIYLDLFLEADYRLKPKQILHVRTDAKVDLTLKSLNAKLKTDLRGLPGPINDVGDIQTQVQMPLKENQLWSEERTQIQSSVPVDLFLVEPRLRPEIEEACHCKLPKKFQINAKADVAVKALLDEPTGEKQHLLNVDLRVEPVDNDLFSADLAMDADIFRLNKEWLVEPRTRGFVLIKSYQTLRRFLDSRGALIPAPLDVLEGTIRLEAKDSVVPLKDHVETHVVATINLKSDQQRVDIESQLTLKLANTLKRLDVLAKVDIDKIRLELPPIDPVMGVPPLSNDRRVIFERKKPAKKSDFETHFLVQLQTTKKSAIELLIRYAKPHVPMSVKVTSVDGVNDGFLRIDPFTVSYLRREVFVEKVQMTLKEKNPEVIPLTGLFRLEQGGYTIFVDVGGTVEAPSIQLRSEPYLPKDDIISVLLYGRPNDRLVSGEAETAGGFNAAMADRAIGLFGLLAFASTPIQSFSYNAVTKVYTATVDLGDGLSASVGTNWEQAANLELRKRLSRRWVLTAAWSPADNNQQEGKLVLQWEKRF